MNTATDIGMIIHGIRLPITSEDVSPIIWQALESGKYEAKEARQVRKLLHTGDRVLELGAGIGVITAVMAQTPGVTIWSFDANPHTIELAERVAAANEIDNVTFRQGLLMSGAPETCHGNLATVARMPVMTSAMCGRHQAEEIVIVLFLDTGRSPSA